MKLFLLHIAAVMLILGQEQSSINGKVLSADDGTAIAGATIMVVNTTVGTSSDAEGRFVLKNIPSKRQQIRISAVGFKSVTVNISELSSDNLVIQLQSSPVLTQAVVITANKRPQSLEEVPVSMNIMTAQSFEQRNTTALDDALRYVPGVNFQQWQINIRSSSGYSRGVGSRVSLLIDGVPLLAGDTGEITFEAIPVFQIDRVEVLKGAGSTLYGSGALGGVVNVLTKDADETPSLYWRLYSGIYSKPAFTQWQWTDSRRMFDGEFVGFSSRYDKLGVVFSVNRLSDDGYRESDWSRKYDGFLKLKYDLSPYQTLTVSSNVFSQYRAEFLWWKDFQHALRPADSSGVTVTSLRLNNSLVYKHFVSDVFYYDVKAVHFRSNWYRDGAGNTRLDQSVSDAIVTDVQANWTLHELHVLTFGVSGNYNRVKANIFGTHNGRGAALYLQDEYRIADALSVIGGIRHDIQEVIGTYTEQQTNPKLAARYTIDEKNTVRLSLGRGFRSPSIGELYTSTSNTGSAAIVVPSVNLKPEHSWTYEVSSTHILSEHLQLDFALFHNDFYDLIEPNVFSDSLVKINFKNITQAEIEGVETSIRTKFFEHALSFDVHYNYNWAVDRNTGAFLRFRPRHIGSVNSTFTVSQCTIGADYRFVSRIEQIDEQLVDLAPIKNGRQRVDIHLVDARVITDLKEIGLPMRMALNVNNLLGYNYNELIGNVSPPRHVVLSLEGVVR